jgi:hypothetical protein
LDIHRSRPLSGGAFLVFGLAWHPESQQIVSKGQEEAGVLIEPERLTGVYKNLKLGVVAPVFRARIVGGQPGPTEESSASTGGPATP